MTFSQMTLSITIFCHNAECRVFYCYAECQYAECRYAECCYAECRYAECLYAECHHAECFYAECHYAECRYAECRSAVEAYSVRESTYRGEGTNNTARILVILVILKTFVILSVPFVIVILSVILLENDVISHSEYH